MFLLKVVRFTMILEVCTALNLTRLIGIYMSSCGEQYLCKEWPGMINYEPHPQLLRCPPCSCEESCYRNRNCCPDKFYERKLAELRMPTFVVADEDADIKFPLYELITTCPSSAKDDDKLLCKSPPLQTKYKGPVTSLATNYSYMNEYCAICHGEDIEFTTIWDISTGGKNEMNIFNFVDSIKMLEKITQNIQMTIIYSPPKKLQSIAPSFYFYHPLPTPTCPGDEDLQAACSSSYVREFRFYRNIFCYICSLTKRTSKNMNEKTCHLKNLTILHACKKNPLSILTIPFRNIYCIICSHPPVLQFPYRQAEYVNPIHASMQYVFEDFSAILNEELIRARNNQKLFLIQFKNITFNTHLLLETIKHTNVKNVSKRIDEDWLDENSKLHLANVMMIASGIYPWRICDMDTLPEVVQNISRKNCDCSFSCLFRAKCTCCIDTAIQHKLQCSSRYKIRSDYTSSVIRESKFLTVSICFQNKKHNLSTPFFDEIKYLCEEQSHAFDLPVVKEGVTYKNVFCFICNRNVDFENDDLSGEEYKIMEFNIICNNQFHFMYKINLNEILEGAGEQNCGVVLNTQEAVLCDEYPTNVISTCKTKGTQKSLKWACEKLNKHSLPPVYQYKNEFCELCNQLQHFQPNETYDGEKYTECNKSNQMHVQYEKACRSLPSLASHPNIFPHRNIFCSYCAQDDHHKEQVPSNFCKPRFGNYLIFPIPLIRHLFIPSLTFDSEISIRSREDTEYGCFPGRIREGNDCRLVVTFPKNIRYSLHILSVLNVVSASNDSNTVLSEIKDSVLAYLRNDSIFMGCELNVFYFIPKPPLTIRYSHGLYHFNLYVVLHMSILYLEAFDRDKVERLLLRYPRRLSITETGTTETHYRNFDLKGISVANITETMLSTDMYILPNEHLSFIQKYKDIAYFDVSFSEILVQRLLICRHRKILKKNIRLDVQNYRLIVLETREIFYVGEYVMDLNDMVGVCAPTSSSVVGSKTTMTEILETITTTLHIISTTGLVILLVIYLLIPNLRTLSGLNIMNSVLSLILMQVTYIITNTFEKTTLQCVGGGMLLHYFWLCMCCCLFICCFCMWRSFSSPTTTQIPQNNARKFTYFVLFSYITPLLVVGGNATILYLLYGDVGYGEKVCFVDNKMSNIVTFVFPLSLICLVNTVLFLHTISKIRLDKTIRKSKQDTSQFIIFGKLFFLTGCVWILQVIEGFLPHISTYSFITIILTSTQGLFIFLSFVTSSRIIRHIKSWRNVDGKRKSNSWNTTCPPTSKDTV